MPARPRATPRFSLQPHEQELYSAFISEYQKEYDLTPSDLRQLEQAAIEYILHVRLTGDELENNVHHLNTRYSHIQQQRGILNDLGLARKERKKTQQGALSEEEAEMRDLLLSLSSLPGNQPSTRNRRG